MKIEEPLEILAENKKEEIISAYSNKYGIDKWLLSQTWDFLKSTDEKTIKALKRGELKKGVKPPKTRQIYDNGQIIKNGKIISLEEYEQIQKDDLEKARLEYLSSLEKTVKENLPRIEEITEG